MSHSLSPVTLKDVPAIVCAEPLKISPISRIVLWVFVAVGILSFLYGLQTASPVEVWSTFHVNFLYWFFLAATTTCFAAVFHICNAQWSRPIRRIFESGNLFFLYSLVPFCILYFGHGHLFQWAHHEIPGKGVWLTSNFVFGRDLVAILVLVFLARRLIALSLRRDIGAIRSGLTGVAEKDLTRWKQPAYDKYVAGWGSDAKAEIAAVHDRLSRLSPAVVIIFALVMSLIAFDLMMSVDAHWYSTLFGAFMFMSSIYCTMAFCSMGVGIARDVHPLFRAKVERRTLHDLGKLLFGFGIFWAYLFWSHYLPIWYGNIPEETHWVILRLREQPWHSFAWLIFGSCFITPFLLGLSKDLKQVPVLLFATGAIVAIGLWLQNYLLFVPTLSPGVIPLNLLDVGITAGFAGAYVLSAVQYLSKVPLIPFGDLYATGK